MVLINALGNVKAAEMKLSAGGERGAEQSLSAGAVGVLGWSPQPLPLRGIWHGVPEGASPRTSTVTQLGLVASLSLLGLRSSERWAPAI